MPNIEPKILLTLGFANLAGDEAQALVAEDARWLSPLFEHVRLVEPNKLPEAHVLFLYAHLNETGTIRGADRSGIRQVAQATKASIIVVAMPNPAESYTAAGKLDGPKSANLVFTLDRKGPAFSKFFHALFSKMRDGENMLMAWVELAPQGPVQPENLPVTVLLSEAGNLAFPGHQQ